MEPIILIKRYLEMNYGGFPLYLYMLDDEFIKCKGLICYYIPDKYVHTAYELLERYKIEESINEIWKWVHQKLIDAYSKHTDKKKTEISSFLSKEFNKFETYKDDNLEINFEFMPSRDPASGELKLILTGTKCI